MNLLIPILLSLSVISNGVFIYLILQYRKVNLVNQQKLALITQENSLIRQQESLKEKQNNYQVCLSKAVHLVDECDTYEIFYQGIIDLISDTLEITFSYVFKLIEPENKLTLWGGKGWRKEQIFNYTIGQDENKIQRLLTEEKSLIVEDKFDLSNYNLVINDDINLSSLVTGANLIIKDPLTQDKIAILGLYSNQKNKFGELEIELLNKIRKIIEKKVIFYSNNKQLKILEKAIDSSPNGIIITDATKQGNPLIYVNSGFEKITGYSSKYALGKNCQFFLQKQDPNQLGIQKIREAIKNQTEIVTTVKNYRKNGEVFWNEIYITPVFNNQGKLSNFIGVQNDITEKYQIEQALSNKTQQLEIFSQKLTKINNLTTIDSESLEQNLACYLQKTCDILDMDIGVIVELVGQEFLVISSYSSNNKDLLLRGENYLINILSERVLKQNQTIYYPNIKDTDLSDNQLLVNQLGIISYLATPIEINHHIYAIIHLFGKGKQRLDTTSYQQDLIETAIQHLSRIILADEAELEKEQMNIALQESTDRLGNILSSLEDVIWSIHPQTFQLMYINSTAEKIYQSNLANFYKKRCFWLDLVHPEQQGQIKEIYANILNVSLFNNGVDNHDLEYRIVLPNGEEKYIRDRAYIIYDSKGDKVRIDGILTDITKSKNIQIASEKREKEFRLLFELAPIGMMITDLGGSILQVNNSLCQLLKYSATELIGSEEVEICHPDDVEKNKLFYHKIFTDFLEQDSLEIRYVTKNATIVYVIIHITVLRDNQGNVIQLIQQIVDISQLKMMEEQILHNALHDNLTNLANRFLLTDRLTQTLKRYTRHSDELCAILVIDIDNFKHINDSMGHKIGDKLLMIIAEKIVNCVSSKDTVARISGDQFAVLLDDLKFEDEVAQIANQILFTCHSNNQIENCEFFSSVSIGITLSSIGYDKPEEMIRDADLTMHQAKEDGKNCYRIFTPIMHDKLLKKIKIETCLRHAINTPELLLYYQPIINLKTGFIAGFEALIRWFCPDLGVVSPFKFIPIAEENNLIIPLGNWILSTAASQLKKWQDKYPELSLFIAVNLSSKQLLDPNLLDNIDRIVDLNKINPSSLKMEITESILMENFDKAKKILKAIQDRKLKISLDDFGTGYSSLSYLHQLPFNNLKIDRSFVQPLEKQSNRGAIIDAIINLAHHLNLDVVAEGIETHTQEQILIDLDCDYGQGYMYSKPVNAEDAEIFIEKLINGNQKKNN